jgi:hypothetical protein
MENSLISEFSTSAFQNTSVETLYLPKIDCVTFKLKSLGNFYNNNNEKSGHIKTLFVNSKLILTSDYSGSFPKSCFWNVTSNNDNAMTYINQFTLELVYSGSKEEVKKLIENSDIVAFFRTWYNQNLTDLADLPGGIDAYMVDGSSGYNLGSATADHPVIVYNYKR